MPRLVAGVDDAGRGAAVGPIVVAGLVLAEENVPRLQEIGVKDSKLLSPKKRVKLAEDIKKLALRYCYAEVQPKEIDEVVKRGKRLMKLNFLEAKAMARAIEVLRPNVAYVDASDALEKRFGSQIRTFLSFPVKVVSKHKADAIYPIVSAASILAKVRRDSMIAELKTKYGDLGSGYMADPRTRAFLKKWLREKGELPDFVRKSWKPIARMLAEARQTRF